MATNGTLSQRVFNTSAALFIAKASDAFSSVSTVCLESIPNIGIIATTITVAAMRISKNVIAFFFMANFDYKSSEASAESEERSDLLSMM